MQRIFAVVVFEQLLLHRLSVSSDDVTGSFLARHAVDRDGFAVDLHVSFRAGKYKALALLASVDKVHAQAQVESFAIVEQAEHHVRHVAAILPKTKSSCCHAARWTVRAGNEMRSAEQVHEQVAGNSAAVGFPFAPLEEVFRIEGDLGGRAQEPRPVTSFWRSVERNG